MSRPLSVAALLGGSRVEVDSELQQGPFLGLDWFLLNLIAYSLLFVPLERLFARLPEQGVFRRGWRTDLAYFFVSSVFVQLLTILTLQPAMVLFDWAVMPELQSWIRRWPGLLQFAGLLLVADLTQYWVHRTFHGAGALAIPCRPPLGGADGLAGGIAPPSSGHRGDPRADVCADLCPRLW